jgi:hypothetical protein
MNIAFTALPRRVISKRSWSRIGGTGYAVNAVTRRELRYKRYKYAFSGNAVFQAGTFGLRGNAVNAVIEQSYGYAVNAVKASFSGNPSNDRGR